MTGPSGEFGVDRREIRAREREQGRAYTPIIALTANVMAHQVKEYSAAGMDGVIAKPIEVEQLFSLLQEVLDRQSEPLSLASTA